MDPKQQVIDAGIRMLKNGITIGAWGNISLRDPESGLIYLTPSGMAYDTLVREDIVVLTPDGTIREGGSASPLWRRNCTFPSTVPGRR